MKSCFLLLLLCFSTLAFTQDSTFRLKDYKYRTPGFRALTVNVNFSGTANESTLGTADKNTSRSFSLAPSQIAYTKIISTDKRLHQSNIALSPWAYFSTTKQNNQERKQNQFESGFQWERTDRFYKNGRWFFEAGNLLNASFSRLGLTDAAGKRTNNKPGFQNTLSIGFGKGRIERVQDAQMALYILNDLEAQRLLSTTVTPALVTSFAQLITDINNKRVFDTRRRRIYELTRIDSFLQSSGLVGKTDIRHFTTVNDDWAFAINPYRQAGTAWFVRLKPAVYYSGDNYDERFTAGGFSQNKSSRFTLALTPETGIEKYVPVSLKWQINEGASLAYQAVRSKSKDKLVSSAGTTQTDDTFRSGNIEFTGYWGAGYFPNTRTQLTANLFTRITFYRDNVAVTPELNLSATYFIGYRTYLTANGYWRYAYYHDKISGDRHLSSAGLGFGFSHILF